MKTKSTILVGLLLVSQTSAVFAYPGESIVLDANGDYIITYWNGANMMHTKIVPATKIDPTVASTLKLGDAGLITYGYTVSNGQNAKQSIDSIRVRGLTSIFSSQPVMPISSGMTPQAAIAAVQSLKAPIVKPAKWDGSAGRDPFNSSATQVNWHFFTDDHPNDPLIGVMPGRTQSGFGFASLDLPGVVAVRLEGETPIQQGYEDEGPDSEDSEIVPQLDQIERNNFIARNAAAPLVAVPIPFDPAVTLERIQAHMHTWIAKQLIEPAFSSQLDSHFQAAINAYRNQGQAGNGQIGKMLALLVQQYEELEKGDEDIVKKKSAVPAQIDKLAALVLYFDLKYVMRRAGGN